MGAEVAVSVAAETLGRLLREKVSALRGVEGQVQWLRAELDRMQCFLRDASGKQTRSAAIKKWISDVREAAHDAEDAVETYALRVDSPNKNQRVWGRISHFPTKLYHLNRLAHEINSIKTRLEAIEQSRVRHGIRSLNDDDEAARLDRLDVERRRRPDHWKPDEHVVGFEGHVDALLEKAILPEGGGLSVTTIAGMGGAGKSTLAKKVYNDEVVSRAGFERRAWVTVSRDFNPKELMKELFKQLVEPDEDQLKLLKIMQYSSEDEVKKMVYDRLLGRRYLVVLDDVWRQEHWDHIHGAFPESPDKAGRLLITSRSNNIPSCAQYIHELKGLDMEKSWELLLKATLVEDQCLPELEGIGKQILEKCKGLPLAITVMGGLLSKQQQTVQGWQNVLNGTRSLIGENNDSVGAVLELSYQDLSPNLKSCFLCLSFFKEDAEIDPYQMAQVWIAAGYVPEKEGEEMEDTANGYLTELINRHMVQAIELFDDGQVQLCHIHDLLRDLSMEKAKEEINLGIFREDYTSGSLNKARHLSVNGSIGRFMSSTNPNMHLRSLFLHQYIHSDDQIPTSYWKRNGGLRVLQLEHIGLANMPEAIGSLIGLKYLNLSGNYIEELPRSLGDLKSLQTLNIEKNANIKVPNVIWKLENLRHLCVSDDIVCEEPLRLNTLKKLQTLTFISAKSIVVEHLAELVSLRLLVMGLTMGMDMDNFFALLAGLRHLSILGLEWTHGNRSIRRIDNLQHLTELEIDGPLQEFPSKLPQTISSISLRNTQLNNDPMQIVQSLPNLLFLGFYMNSYIGNKMEIARIAFPQLRILCLSRIYNLTNLHIGEGGMPKLEQLKVESCPDLEIAPGHEELRVISSLRELKILDTSRRIENKLKSKKYSHIILNIPSVVISSL